MFLRLMKVGKRKKKRDTAVIYVQGKERKGCSRSVTVFQGLMELLGAFSMPIHEFEP